MENKLELKDIEKGSSNGYDTNYIVYIDKDKGTKIHRQLTTTHSGIKNTNHSCFAGLSWMLEQKPKHNRLIYNLKSKKKSSVAYTMPPLDLRKTYVELCIKYKALPDYIKDDNISLNQYVIKLDDKNLTPSLLYVYLCSLRMMQECPVFIKNMINLVHKHNISFYLAWSIASKISTSNTAHNILYAGTCGGIVPKDISKLYVNIRKCRGLMKYLQNPKKYDTHKTYTSNNIRSDTIITNAGDKSFDKDISLDRCKHPDLNLAIDSKIDRIALKHLGKYEKEIKKWSIKKCVSTLTTRK